MLSLKKALSVMFGAVIVLSFCGCMNKAPSSSQEQSSSTSQAPATQGTTESNPEETAAIPVEQLQLLYDKAPEYNYMAIGYYDSKQDGSGMVRDGYVPYDENFTQKESTALESSAHGVKVRLSITDATSASEALGILSADYSARLEAEGFMFAETNSAQTADNDTVGFLSGAYRKAADQDVLVVLYADIRDDGSKYMCAEIELDQAGFDEYTKELVAEMDDVYGLTFSNLDIIAAL